MKAVMVFKSLKSQEKHTKYTEHNTLVWNMSWHVWSVYTQVDEVEQTCPLMFHINVLEFRIFCGFFMYFLKT